VLVAEALKVLGEEVADDDARKDAKGRHRHKEVLDIVVEPLDALGGHDVVEDKVKVGNVKPQDKVLKGRGPLDLEAVGEVGRDLQEAEKDLELVGEALARGRGPVLGVVVDVRVCFVVSHAQKCGMVWV
jgi:hypothetical protein